MLNLSTDKAKSWHLILFTAVLIFVPTSRNDWEPPSHAPVATSSQTPRSCRAVDRQSGHSKNAQFYFNQLKPALFFTYDHKINIFTFNVFN